MNFKSRLSDKVTIRWKFLIAVIGILGFVEITAYYWIGNKLEKQSLKNAQDTSLIAAQLVREGLTMLMVVDEMGLSNDLFKNIATIQNVKNIRVIRSPIVDSDFAEGKGTNPAQDNLDQEVLSSGKPSFIVEKRENVREYRAVIPYIAETKCLKGCHVSVAKGHVLGAISMNISLKEIDMEIEYFKRNMLYSSMLAAIFLGLFFAFLFQNLIATPLKNVSRRFKEIADEGDLTKRLNLFKEDEIGEHAKCLDTFLQKIHDTVAQISSTSSSVAAASAQVAASIEDTSSTTDRISKGAATQNSAVEASRSAIIEMDNAIKEVAESSNMANTISNKAINFASAGGETVKQAIDAMNLIEESSRKIEIIVGVITDIANQTNLLALNAAIEAAKAGEQGKGFAVVAEEVRKLAERSGESTKQIKQLISESTTRVALGTKTVTDAGESLANIIKGVNEITSLVKTISGSTHQQSEGSDQVKRAIDKLAIISEDNSSSTEELSSTTNELAKSADELSNMAEKLTQVVNQFKVDCG